MRSDPNKVSWILECYLVIKFRRKLYSKHETAKYTKKKLMKSMNHQSLILEIKVVKTIAHYLYASSSFKHPFLINSPREALSISSSFTIREEYILIVLPNLQDPMREGYKYSTSFRSSIFMKCHYHLQKRKTSE